MKKVIFSLGIFSLVFAASCGNDDDNNDRPTCEVLNANYIAARDAFSENLEDEELCIDFRVAARAYLDADCISGDQENLLEAQLELLDCSN